MVNLKDYLLQGNIFTEMKSLEPFSFLDGDNDYKLDLLINMNYGKRNLYSEIAGKTLKEVAQMIIFLNKDKWNNAILVASSDNEIGLNDVRKVTENIVTNENRTNNRDDVNKVSAYNSDELINNDGMNSVSNEDMDNTKNRTLTDGKYNLSTAYENLSLLSKNNIMEMVVKDTVEFMTLSIY